MRVIFVAAFWLGLVLSLGGCGISLGDIANWDYVVGLVVGTALAFGIANMVKGWRRHARGRSLHRR
jgi:hypothetical protein